MYNTELMDLLEEFEAYEHYETFMCGDVYYMTDEELAEIDDYDYWLSVYELLFVYDEDEGYSEYNSNLLVNSYTENDENSNILITGDTYCQCPVENGYTYVFSLDGSWVDEDGNINYFNNPVEIGRIEVAVPDLSETEEDETTGELKYSNITFEYSETDWTNEDVTVTATLSSEIQDYVDNGVYTIQYAVVNSGDSLTDEDWQTLTADDTTGNYDVTFSENGTLYVRLVDTSGNEGNYATADVTNIDKTDPTVEISSYTTNSVTFTGTDTLSGIVEYAVTTSSTAPTDGWTEITTTNSLEETTVGSLSDGTEYYVWLKDAAGNTGYETFTTESVEDVEIEQSLVGKYVAYTPDSGNSYDLTASTYTGTTYNSTVFTTDTSLNWQIWSISDDELILIADDTAQSGGYYYTSSSYCGWCLYLTGAYGYNNGVYLLNDICETLYSNSELGATARSLDIIDIEEVLNWSVWAPTDYICSTYPCYDMNTTLQYSSNKSYPVIWAEEDFANIDGTTVNTAYYTYDEDTNTHTYTGSKLRRNEQTSLYTSTYNTASSYIEVTDTYWKETSSTLSSAWTDSTYASLVFITHEYWLASRCVYPYSSYASFGLQSVDLNNVGFDYLFYSSGSARSDFRGVRPVVTIPLDSLALNTWDYSGDTTDDAYTLVEKTEENQVITGSLSSSDQVEFSEVTWEDETASITLTSTNSDLYIQYQVVGEDEEYSSSDSSWTTSDNKGTVDLTNLDVNSTIYVRLYDGYNYGGYGSFNIIDYIGPTVTITATVDSYSEVTVAVTSAVDYQSGMPDKPTYIYQYKEEGSTTWYTAAETTETEYTITGLISSTDYTIRVRVADNGGTYGAATEDITTDDLDEVVIAQSLVGKYVEYTPDSGNSYDLTASTYTGNTNNSTVFTTDTSLNWQIWSITDDTLTLIADDTAQSGGYDYTSSDTYGWCLYLTGALGYNNAVYLLNDICETLYSNSELEATARSLDIVDIEEVLNWDYWAPTSQNTRLSSIYCYTYNMNRTYQYTSSSYRKYPVIWAEEDFANIDGTTVNTASYSYDSSTGTITYTGSGLRRNEQTSLYTSTYATASNYIEVTRTLWTGASGSSYYKDSKHYSLVNCGKYYWLASRCVLPYSTSCARFGLQNVYARGEINANNLFDSGVNERQSASGVRPVVSIPLDTLTLNTWDYTGDTADDAYKLVEKTEENLSGGVTSSFSSSDQVEFSEVTWEDEMASITLTSTNSDLYIQYQVVGEDGTYSDDDWTTSDNKGTVDLTNLDVNSTIYVRLYDGYNYGGYGSFNIIDYIGPTVTISTSDILATSVTVTVDSAVDYQSGMPDSPTYIYQYKEDGSTTWYTVAETTATEYTITGLTYSTDYTIRVRVADNGGAYGAGTEDITTDNLIGYYVAYTPDSDNTYDLVTNSSTYTGTTGNDTDFTTDTSLNWQIWSISDDELVLIADDVADSGGYYYSSYGYYTLSLAGNLGYNNGVYLLNDICETLYSNSELGATARSLDIQDIEEVLDWSKWAPTDYYYSSSYDSYTYISTKQYTSNIYYPGLWPDEDYANIDGTTVNTASYTYNSETGTLTYTGSKLRRSDQTALNTTARGQASSYIEPTETYWFATASTLSSAWTDSKYASLVNCGKYYWLASRFVCLDSQYASFGLNLVGSSGSLYSDHLFRSSGDPLVLYFGVRPVVSIPLTSLSLDIESTSGADANNGFLLVEN